MPVLDAMTTNNLRGQTIFLRNWNNSLRYAVLGTAVMFTSGARSNFYDSGSQGLQYGTFRICVLRTSHLEPYRTSVPYQHQGPAPQGAFRGRAPPKILLVPHQTKIVSPPSEDCAPKKFTDSGLMKCKLRPKTPKLVFTARIFVIFVDSHRIS